MMAFAMEDAISITVGMGLVANAGIWPTRQGQKGRRAYRANGSTFPAQIYNARFNADGTIKADGKHITGWAALSAITST
ncbi:hypothetical protein [Selenomonas sp. AB3002]|uniref:hypothetical protein n=1 Tax=Selenomonas sp. AB3002 TaxID=1392502 RepID=UPI000496BD53